jgi:hypothetical protein
MRSLKEGAGLFRHPFDTHRENVAVTADAWNRFLFVLLLAS